MNKRTHTPVLAGLLFLFLAAALLICPGNVKAAGKTPVKNTTIRLSKTVFTYNGKVQKPAVTVTYQGKKLKVRKDYTLTYSKGRKNPGFLYGNGGRNGQLYRNGEENLPHQSCWCQAGDHDKPGRRNHTEADLEASFQGHLRLPDPLFHSEGF